MAAGVINPETFKVGDSQIVFFKIFFFFFYNLVFVI